MEVLKSGGMKGADRSRFVLLLAGMVAVSSFWPTDAEACGCVADLQGQPSHIRNEFQRAVAVFTAEAIEADLLRATFRVANVWKGKPEPELTIWTSSRMFPWGPLLTTTCDWRFQKGRRYLVFGYGPINQMKTSVCSPTATTEAAKPIIALLDEITRKGGIR